MDDAQLVVAAGEGDGNAYGAIYDRYADRIHDFCASLLRNRAEAADALQETFLVAFTTIGRLAEPNRLRSWLYAIAHRAVQDRAAGGAPGADDIDAILGAGVRGQRLSRAELAEFVWDAAGGLDLADRALLDLHLRQGLDGRDLAGATGLTTTQLEARLPRLEARVERSLGALVVARTANRTCPDLAAILTREEQDPTPDFRTELTAHVDDCERCNSSRRIAPSSLNLLASAPLTPAPAYLRGVVLGKASGERREAAPALAGWEFRDDGFPELAGTGRDLGEASKPRRRAAPARPAFSDTQPTAVIGRFEGSSSPSRAATAYLPSVGSPPLPDAPDRSGRSGRPDGPDRRGMVIGALVGVIVLVAAVVVVLASRGNSPSGTVSVGTSTTLGGTTTAATVTTTTLTTLPVIVAQSTTTSTTVAIGQLVAGAKNVDLGVNTINSLLQLSNSGDAAVTFTATAAGTGLSVSPAAGSVASGANQTLTISLDRTMAAPGPFTGSILIETPRGTTNIAITALVDPGPTILVQPASPATVASGATNCKAPTTAEIMATVTATQPLTEVVLHFQYATGGDGAGTSDMTMTGTVYTGVLPPSTAMFSTKGTVTWWVTAIDSAGQTGTSSNQMLTVC